MKVLYVPYIKQDWQSFKWKSPLFQLIGLRSVIAGHTQMEEALLQKYAANRQSIVEIGVAEGASALVIRRVANPLGKLYLIDPYLSGRIPGLNLSKEIAHRHVSSCLNANVIWVEEFSYNTIKIWDETIDFLFLDGDHSYQACLQDWLDWSPFVEDGGIVAFHDARLFSNGWTTQDTGSVRVVNQLFRHNENPVWEVIDEVDSLVIVQKVQSK